MTHLSFYKNKNVLVTGGAGFIGSHLTEALVRAHAHVTVLDNFSSGFLYNLHSIKNDIRLLEGDITDGITCTQATHNQEILFHCAALVSVPEAEADPTACFNNNITGTFNLLEAAAQNTVQHFVFSSSAAVYGPQKEPCHENMVCAPTSVYGYSKLIGELLCKQFSVRTTLKTTILRYFNVYGARQNADHPYAGVVAKFMQALQKNQPITLFGDGEQTRDFVPVSDIVHANMLLGSLADSTCAEVYNIGTGKSISLNALFKQLKSDFPNYIHDLQYAPARAGDIKHSQAICDKLLVKLSDNREVNL